MKKIEAIIKPFKLDETKDTLAEIGIDGMTVYEIQGNSELAGTTERYRASEYTVDFTPVVKLELVLADSSVKDATDIIKQINFSGKSGDGKIFVSDIVNIIRIRTGEKGEDAI